jgi:hypothetical protein
MMPKRWVRIENLTETETEALVEEIAERLKDLVYMNGRQQAMRAVEVLLKRLKTGEYSPNDPFTLAFKFNMNVSDVLQIIGRIKRKTVE